MPEIEPPVARGKFEVSMTPTPDEPAPPGPALGRMLLAKRFSGDLEGISQGQMLTAMTSVDGSAGYVAIERFAGALRGRKGSFVLQHDGVMDRGLPKLSVSVVPDSGTEELVGIAGNMEIIVTDGEHSYEFRYFLPMPEGPTTESSA